MSCIKNPKKFLWIKYDGDHDLELLRIWKFMDCSTDFHTKEKCKLCGLEKEFSFVTAEDLIRRGIPIENLNSGDYNRSLY